MYFLINMVHIPIFFWPADHSVVSLSVTQPGYFGFYEAETQLCLGYHFLHWLTRLFKHTYILKICYITTPSICNENPLESKGSL